LSHCRTKQARAAQTPSAKAIYGKSNSANISSKSALPLLSRRCTTAFCCSTTALTPLPHCFHQNRLPLKEAITLGLRLPPELVLAISHKGASDGDEDKDDEADSDDEMEEVTGYHFMDCVPLFVSYVYVNSASKVLEDRLVNRGLQVEFPDFEAVYHLVIDSVDSYNEAWERSFKEQEQMKVAVCSLCGGRLFQ
jgi:hypothetical protein